MIIKNICQIVVLSGGLIAQVFAQQQMQIKETGQQQIDQVSAASISTERPAQSKTENQVADTSVANTATQSALSGESIGLVDPYLKLRTAVPLEPEALNENNTQNVQATTQSPVNEAPTTQGDVKSTEHATVQVDTEASQSVAVKNENQAVNQINVQPLSVAEKTSIPVQQAIANQLSDQKAAEQVQGTSLEQHSVQPVTATQISTVTATERALQFEKQTTIQTSSVLDDEPHATVHITLTTSRPIVERDLILAVNLESKLASNEAIVLKDLSFKTVMMSFYQKNMKHIAIPELDAENRQYIGFSQHEPDINAVLVFDQAEPFQNANKEIRYILTVSKLKLEPETNKIEYCPTCSAFTDIYVFKKTADEQFQLVSHSPVGEGWWSQGIKTPQYSAPDLRQSIVSIGPNQKGIVTKQEVSTYTEGYRALDITPIYENKPLNQIRVAKLEASNRGSEYHKTYNTKAYYKLLDSVNDGLYDIEVHLTGTRLVEQKSNLNLVPVNEKQLYQFNAKKQKYIRLK